MESGFQLEIHNDGPWVTRNQIFEILQSDPIAKILKSIMMRMRNFDLYDNFLGVVNYLGYLSNEKNKKDNEEQEYSFLINGLKSCAEEKNLEIFLKERENILQMINQRIGRGEIDESKMGDDWGYRLDLAILTSFFGHSLQKRKGGDPYIIHPLQALQLYIENTENYSLDAWIAICLHDFFEDLKGTFHIDYLKDTIEEMFGSKDVVDLVEGVTSFGSNKESNNKLINKKKILEQIVNDIRCLGIKLADRLHNMNTIESMTEEAKKRIAEETLDFYIPLARKFGFRTMENKLAEKALEVLSPDKKQSLDRCVEGMYPVKKMETLINYSVEHFLNEKYYRIMDLLSEIYDLKNQNNAEDKDKCNTSFENLKKHLGENENLLISTIGNFIDSEETILPADSIKKINDEIEKKFKIPIKVITSKITLNKYLRSSLKNGDTLSTGYEKFDEKTLQASELFRIVIECDHKAEVLDEIKSMIHFIGVPFDSREVAEDSYNPYNGIVGKAYFSSLVRPNSLYDFKEGKFLMKEFLQDEQAEVLISNYGKGEKILIEIIEDDQKEANQKGVLYHESDSDKNSIAKSLQNVNFQFIQNARAVEELMMLCGNRQRNQYSVANTLKNDILNIIQNANSVEELIRLLSQEILAPNQIRIFGNDGKSMIVPKGTTAYQTGCFISSELALNFESITVNGEMRINPNYVLEDGDKIVINTETERKINFPDLFLLLRDGDINMKEKLRNFVVKKIKDKDANYGIESIVKEGKEFFSKIKLFFGISEAVNLESQDIQRFYSGNPEIEEKVSNFSKNISSFDPETKFYLAIALNILEVDDLLLFVEQRYGKLEESKESVLIQINYGESSVFNDLNKDDIECSIIGYFANIAEVKRLESDFENKQISAELKLAQSKESQLQQYLILETIGDIIFKGKSFLTFE